MKDGHNNTFAGCPTSKVERRGKEQGNYAELPYTEHFVGTGERQERGWVRRNEYRGSDSTCHSRLLRRKLLWNEYRMRNISYIAIAL